MTGDQITALAHAQPFIARLGAYEARPGTFFECLASQFKTRHPLSFAWYSVINDSILLGEAKL